MAKGASGAAAGGPGMIVQEVVAQVKKVMTDIVAVFKTGFARMKATILETVAVFRPLQVELFNRAMRDLQAVFGRLFLPVLRQATDWVRKIANYFYSLPKSFEKVITAAAKFTIIFGGIVTAILAVKAAFVAFVLPFINNIGVMVLGIMALGRAFALTKGGAKFLTDALETLEQVFAGIVMGAAVLWESLREVRDQLSVALSTLGEALAELLDALKPLMAAGLVAAVFVIRSALWFLIKAITVTATMIKVTVDLFVKALSPLAVFLRKFGLDLPSVKRSERSAFGLGTGGGQVHTDVSSFHRQITEEILKNTRPATDAEAGVEKYEDKVVRLLDSIDQGIKLLAAVKETPGKIAGAAGKGALKVAQIIVGGVGLAYGDT